MVPTILNYECNSIKSMAITIKAYGIQLLIYTNSQQILSHFSQRIQYKRNKFPVGRVSKNHQRSHWNKKKIIES